MHSPTEVASPDSPSGRLSRWFSIRRGSSHNYDVGKEGRGGSLEKEIKPLEKSGKMMPQLVEVSGFDIVNVFQVKKNVFF